MIIQKKNGIGLKSLQVSEIQRERVLSEVVSVVFCDFDDFIPNTIEP